MKMKLFISAIFVLLSILTLSQVGRVNAKTSANVITGPITSPVLTLKGLRAAFGSKLGNPRYNPLYDADKNGFINILDFSILRKRLIVQ